MIIHNQLQNTNEIKFLIFDIDGTITRWTSIDDFFKQIFDFFKLEYQMDYRTKIFKAMENNELTTLISGEAPIEQYAWFISEQLPILRHNGISALDFVKKQMELEIEAIFINDDVKYTLELLSNHFFLVCMTNWYSFQAIKKLEKFNLINYFKDIHAFNTNYIKPSRACIEWILLKHGFKSNQTIMIGDTSTDISSAKAANVQPILINYDNKPFSSDEPVTNITEFSDIPKLILRKD